MQAFFRNFRLFTTLNYVDVFQKFFHVCGDYTNTKIYKVLSNFQILKFVIILIIQQKRSEVLREKV